MKCYDARELLSPYIDNEIAENDRAVLDQHLASCHRCSAELRELRRMVEGLHQLPPVNVPPDFMNRLHERLQAEKVVPLKGAQYRDLRTRSRAGWFAASAAAVALTVGIYGSSLIPATTVATLLDKIPGFAETHQPAGNVDRILDKTIAGNTAPGSQPAPKSGAAGTEKAVPDVTVAANTAPAEPKAAPAGAAPAKPVVTQPVEVPKYVTTMNMQIAVKSFESFKNDVYQLAANNQALVESKNGTVMSGQRVIRVRIPKDRVDALIKGIDGLSETSAPQQGRDNITRTYYNTQDRLAAVNNEIAKLSAKESLTEAEIARLRALEEQKIDQEGALELMERNLEMVEVNLSVTEEATP
ncbi:MAG: DUF4349 domain-containing protein [Solirubrobacterales bacterium]